MHRGNNSLDSYFVEKDGERVLELTPSLRMFFIDNIGTFLLLLILIVFSGYEVSWIGFYSLLAAMLVCIVLLYRYWYNLTVKWTISDEQIRSEQGVFIHDAQYIELYRVVDYSERQSFLQMMVGVKDIIVYSGDRTDPALRIYGIPGSVDVVRHLKRLVEQQKKINNIYEITNR